MKLILFVYESCIEFKSQISGSFRMTTFLKENNRTDGKIDSTTFSRSFFVLFCFPYSSCSTNGSYVMGKHRKLFCILLIF